MGIRAARFSDRFIAYVLDVFPFVAGASACVWALLGPLGYSPTAQLLALVGASWTTLLFGYQLLGNVRGGTLGKRLMGLRLIAREGGEPGFMRALTRAAVWMLGTPLANAGFLVALFNRENRALHDYASGTVVVESYRKSAVEGALLFAAAAAAAITLFSYQIYSAWTRPTPRDVAVLARAKDGLVVIGRIQDVYKEQHGTFASSLEELAKASGDPGEFKTAMAELFQTGSVALEAGNRGWRIRARARDRRGSLVSRDGP